MEQIIDRLLPIHRYYDLGKPVGFLLQCITDDLHIDRIIIDDQDAGGSCDRRRLVQSRSLILEGINRQIKFNSCEFE